MKFRSPFPRGVKAPAFFFFKWLASTSLMLYDEQGKANVYSWHGGSTGFWTPEFLDSTFKNHAAWARVPKPKEKLWTSTPPIRWRSWSWVRYKGKEGVAIIPHHGKFTVHWLNGGGEQGWMQHPPADWMWQPITLPPGAEER